MDNRANEAYLIAIINNYERQINKKTTATMKTMVLKEVIGNLGDLLDFMSDKKATESKSTLELNADLTEIARAYKSTISDQEVTITTLAMDIRENGYKYDKEIKELKTKLVKQEIARKELFEECWEAEIENGKYVIEIEDLKSNIKQLETRNSAWKSKWDENISC